VALCRWVSALLRCEGSYVETLSSGSSNISTGPRSPMQGQVVHEGFTQRHSITSQKTRIFTGESAGD
jgi:hypothetical protein